MSGLPKDKPKDKPKGRAFYKYWIENNIAIDLSEKIRLDFDILTEFILMNSPYTEADLMKKDILDYYRILYRCEDRVQAQIDSYEKNNNK